MPSLKDYDTLDCPMCETPSKPKRVSAALTVSYECPGPGCFYKWGIDRDGDIVNERRQA